MKTIALISTLTFLASLGAATAAPLPVQAGIETPESALVQVRTTKKKAKKSSKRMNNMKGMDHSKMPM